MSLFGKDEYGDLKTLFDSIEAVVKDVRKALKAEEKRFSTGVRYETVSHGGATTSNVRENYEAQIRLLQKLRTDLLTRIGIIDQKIKNKMVAKRDA